jgi:Na+-transporting NADH:ubiquinone oxidoreductase subunit C
MSKINVNSSSYTIIFSIVMVVVVGFLLSFFSDFTAETRKANGEIKLQLDVLAALGIGEAQGVTRDNAVEKFKANIKEQYIIEGTKATPDNKAYLINLKKELDKAKSGGTPRLPLFVAEIEGKKKYIMAVRGNGLWDAIWGYITLNDDLKTIYGVYFDHKAETPGLGANITQAYFVDDFKDEHLFDKSGNFKGIAVSKSNNDPDNVRKDDSAVDALSGATITGNGLSAMIEKGYKAYQPYFETLKK